MVGGRTGEFALLAQAVITGYAPNSSATQPNSTSSNVSRPGVPVSTSQPAISK